MCMDANSVVLLRRLLTNVASVVLGTNGGKPGTFVRDAALRAALESIFEDLGGIHDAIAKEPAVSSASSDEVRHAGVEPVPVLVADERARGAVRRSVPAVGSDHSSDDGGRHLQRADGQPRSFGRGYSLPVPARLQHSVPVVDDVPGRHPVLERADSGSVQRKRGPAR